MLGFFDAMAAGSYAAAAQVEEPATTEPAEGPALEEDETP
jgi:hypothetical protein